MQAKDAFRFYTRLILSELTGLRASTLKTLAELIRTVPDASIYHHTHRFLQQHQYLSPEPPNDFAYWVSNVLGERELGERLSSIDTMQFNTIAGLREKIAKTIEEYLKEVPDTGARRAGHNEAFHFIKSVSFIIPTDYTVSDLKGFSEILKQITIDSIYFHIFEARLRLGKGENDFSNWMRSSLGDKKLADDISRLDPYAYTLEELRMKVIELIEKRMKT